MSVTMYGIRNCDTVRKARAWMDENGVAYAFHDYKAQGIDAARLAGWVDAVGWEVLLNRAGTTFRKLPDADKADLDAAKAQALMVAQPSMIKRPVVSIPAGLWSGFPPIATERRCGSGIVSSAVRCRHLWGEDAMATTRQKPATWFTVMAVVLMLWGVMGCFAFYSQHIMDPPMADQWTRDFVARQPRWFAPVYAVAVGAQLLGSIRLLMRSRGAVWVYVVALVATVIQFGWVFLATELIAVKGAAATVPFPAVIIAVCVFQLWLARFALRRGWIG